MSAPELFSYIFLAILLQLAAFSAVAFYRHMRAYTYLQKRLAGYDADPPVAPNAANPAWNGYRQFRVEKRVYETTDRSVCSFYLKPVDGGPAVRA